MFRNDLDVTLEGQDPVRVRTDQRDVAHLEMVEWYGERKAMVTTLRHLAYTAMLRNGMIPAETSWDEFNNRLCVHVDGVADEDEGQEGEQGGPPPSTPGPTTTSGTPSSTSPSSAGSRSRARAGSRTGTRATSTP